MEVVHVVRQYKPSVGGLEDAVQNLCTHLASLPDMRVRIVTLDRLFAWPDKSLPIRETLDGIEITRISYIGSNRYPIAPSVLKAVKSADIVHVHAIDFFFDYFAFTRFIHHKPLVASTHGGFFHTSFAASLKKIFFNTVTRFSSHAYDSICASSENDAELFRRISPQNVITVENGVNVEKWHDAGSKSVQRNIIFIGRWSVNKRVDGLIALMAQLRRLHPEWQLHIVGLPSDETVESLTAKAKEQEITDGIYIHASPSEDRIKALLGQMSYIASASSYEGFGISIVEGLSAGLFPLLSPIPTFEKLLNALGFGERITPDLQATAISIERNHAVIAADIASYRTKAIVLASRYAWDDVARSMLPIYEKALWGARGGELRCGRRQ